MMKRLNARKSIIWRISKESLMEIVNKSKTITEVLSHFNLRNVGGNFKTLKQRLNEEGVDYSHIPKGIGHRKGKKFPNQNMMSLEDANCKLFIDYGDELTIPLKKIKLYIKRYNCILYECGSCNLKSEWNNKPLSLQLDHIDGNTKNNKLENLRWLCPNCHSQTDTFAGKSLRKERPPTISQIDPNWRRRPVFKNRKVNRPLKEELKKLLTSNTPYTTIGKMFGVSDNAVRKWANAYELI